MIGCSFLLCHTFSGLHKPDNQYTSLHSQNHTPCKSRDPEPVQATMMSQEYLFGRFFVLVVRPGVLR
jgi:hypothetical protein